MFPSTPLVKLGNKHFKIISEFLSRFGSIPDLLELDHLTVSGDVTFGKGVSLRGTVIIIANHGDRIDIPAGSILENKIVSGNLRIMDHWHGPNIRHDDLIKKQKIKNMCVFYKYSLIYFDTYVFIYGMS